MQSSSPPRVGVGILIPRGDQLLLIRRRGSHGQGTWSTPGGHLEFGESPESCAVRETSEEVGVRISNLHFVGITNDIFDAARHYITIWMEAEHHDGEPHINAAAEVEAVGWYDRARLPEPLFLPLWNLIVGNGYSTLGGFTIEQSFSPERANTK